MTLDKCTIGKRPSAGAGGSTAGKMLKTRLKLAGLGKERIHNEAADEGTQFVIGDRGRIDLYKQRRFRKDQPGSNGVDIEVAGEITLGETVFERCTPDGAVRVIVRR